MEVFGNTSSLTNSATISATGGSAFGLHAKGNDNTEINTSSTITTSGAAQTAFEAMATAINLSMKARSTP
jgi:hypothetical protein